MPDEVKQMLFSVKEAAIILGRSVPSIWRDASQGRLPVIRYAGSTRIRRETLEAIITGEAPQRPPRPLKGGAAAKVEVAAARKIASKPEPEHRIAPPEPERVERVRRTKREPEPELRRKREPASTT